HKKTTKLAWLIWSPVLLKNLAWPLITVQGPLTVLQREHGPPPGRSLSPGDDCRNT
ncbi:Gamma-glutamyl phosphate reductase, partial [Dissostichus eleginoides]